MISITSNPVVRNAVSIAHAERGAALAEAWHWLFGGKSSR